MTIPCALWQRGKHRAARAATREHRPLLSTESEKKNRALQQRWQAMAARGTKRPIRDVPYSTVIGGKAGPASGHAKIDMNGPKRLFADSYDLKA
jgi:hypothetical protein